MGCRGATYLAAVPFGSTAVAPTATVAVGPRSTGPRAVGTITCAAGRPEQPGEGGVEVAAERGGVGRACGRQRTHHKPATGWQQRQPVTDQMPEPANHLVPAYRVAHRFAYHESSLRYGRVNGHRSAAGLGRLPACNTVRGRLAQIRSKVMRDERAATGSSSATDDEREVLTALQPHGRR